MIAGFEPKTIFCRNLIGNMELLKNLWTQYFVKLFNDTTQSSYIEEIETVGTCHTTQTRKHQERTKNPDKQQSTESELKSFGDTTDKKCANDEETS